MLKRICLVFLIIFIFVCITGCKETITIQQIHADRIILAENFDQLINVSDLIIKAEVLPGKETVLLIEEDGLIGVGYTVTELKVKEVFQGNVNKDDIIVITEEYFIYDEIIWTQGNYLPAQESKDYIFFLKKYSNSTKRYSGMYFPIDLEQGKYSLDSKIIDNIESLDELTNVELEVWENSDKDYRDWYKKVIEKYCPNH